MSYDSPKDQIIIEKIEKAILKNVGGIDLLRKEFSAMIRKALDEVIDTPRTGRLTLDQIEKTEKTYIGTKVEILFRNMIGFPKGILDLNIDGMDVDIKNTIGTNWTLPPEVINKACILISANEDKALCNLGLVIARDEYLSLGKNRDGKRTISKKNFNYIHWIFKDLPYEPNFWRDIKPEAVKKIFKPRGGTDRLVQMLKEIRDVPIHRNIIIGIAQQDDSLKRIRKNGGARDKLAQDNIVVLSGAFDKKLIEKFGLPKCTKSEFISYKAQTPEEITILKDKLT